MTVPAEAKKWDQVTIASATAAVNTGIYATNKTWLSVTRTRAGVDTVLSVDTDYTVGSLGVSGGCVLTIVGQAVSDIITTVLSVPSGQLSTYPTGATIDEIEIEADIDELELKIQQVEEKYDRALKMPVTATQAQRDGATIDLDVTDGLVLTQGAGGAGIPGWGAVPTFGGPAKLYGNRAAMTSATTDVTVGTRAVVLGEAETFELTLGTNPEDGNAYQGVGINSVLSGYYWKRQYTGRFQAEWWGLTFTAWQAAIDYCTTAGNWADGDVRSLDLPEGIFTRETNEYLRLKEGVDVRGKSPQSTILRPKYDTRDLSSGHTLTQSAGTATLVFALAHGLTTNDMIAIQGAPSKAITAFANAGGGSVTVTSSTHELSDGDEVVISGTTDYNGTFTISSVTTNTFNIVDTYVSAETSGNWALNASSYNGVHKVTVTNTTTVTFRVDSGAFSPATISAAKCTIHPFTIIAGGFAPPSGDTRPNVFGLYGVGFLTDDTVTVPDEDVTNGGCGHLFIYDANEFRVDRCRFVNTGEGNDEMTSIRVDQFLDGKIGDDNVFDQGSRQVFATTQTSGIPSGCSFSGIGGLYYTGKNYSLDLDDSFNCKINATFRAAGGQSAFENTYIRLRDKCSANTITGIPFRNTFDKAIWIEGDRNTVSGNTFMGSVMTTATPTITSITEASGVATITFDDVHGLLEERIIYLSGASPSIYNGANRINSAPDDNTVTIAITSGTGNTSTQPTGLTYTRDFLATNYKQIGIHLDGSRNTIVGNTFFRMYDTFYTTGTPQNNTIKDNTIIDVGGISAAGFDLTNKIGEKVIDTGLDYTGATGAYVKDTLPSAIAADEAFWVYAKVKTLSSRNHGIVYIGDQDPPAVSGSTVNFALEIDSDDILYARLTNAAGQWNGLRMRSLEASTAGQWRHDVWNEVIFHRTSGNEYELWLNGVKLTYVEHRWTAGGPRCAVAVAGTNFAVGRTTSSNLLDGYVGAVAYKKAALTETIANQLFDGDYDSVAPDILIGHNLKRTITLTAAQVLALNSTPLEILPAFGAAKAVRVKTINAFLDYNSAAYAGGYDAQFRYKDASGTVVADEAPFSGFFDRTADTSFDCRPTDNSLGLTANEAIIIRTTGSLTTGNSPVTIIIDYEVINL